MIDLSARQSHSIGLAVCERIESAVAGASERDQEILRSDQQVEAREPFYTAAPWEGASDINYPLTREAELTILSQIVHVLRREPLVIVRAQDPDDQETALKQERFLASRFQEIGLDRALMEVAGYAVRHPVGILYCGWCERHRKRIVTVYRRAGEVTEDAPDDEAGWTQEVVARPDVAHEGPEVRAVPTSDFYLYPADSRSIDQASGVGERVWLTAEGIRQHQRDYGWSQDAVDKLLESGPTHSVTDIREDQAAQVGVDPQESGADGWYELFCWYCRCPEQVPGSEEIPEWVREYDLCVVCCPERRICLHIDYSPYAERPYVAFYLKREPGRFYGLSIPDLLRPLQDEANATIRHFIDSVDITSTPCYKVTQSAAAMNESVAIRPGGIVLVTNPTDVQPFESMPVTNQPIEILELIDGKSRELYSAAGYGQMQSKVRRAAETQAINAAAADKFGLFLMYLSQGIETVFERIAGLYADRMGSDGVDWLDAEGQGKIMPEDLRGRYSYLCAASSQAADPQARLQSAMAAKQISDQYNALLIHQPPMPLEVLRRAWYASREVLVDLGKLRPERYIGSEPSEEQQAPAPAAMGGVPGMPPGITPMMPAAQMGGRNGGGVPAQSGAGVPHMANGNSPRY